MSYWIFRRSMAIGTYISPGCPGDSSPQYSPKVLIFRRPGHYAYRSGHSKAQIFAEDLFGILPREMVLGPSSLLFRRVLLPQDRRRPDLRQLFSQGLGFPTFVALFYLLQGVHGVRIKQVSQALVSHLQSSYGCVSQRLGWLDEV